MNGDKYLVKINGVEYHSYRDVCQDYNIDLHEFLIFKSQNVELTQLELLNHFFQNVRLRLDDGSFIVG